MRIFLSGASGFIGGHLRRLLVALDHQVVAFARRPGSAETGVTWVQGDIADVGRLLAGMAGCDAVIHLVGIIREQGLQTFESQHVQATINVLTAMRHRHIARLLHMSALGAAPHASIPYYVTKWRAEEAVRASQVDYTIFRPSIVFGPGDGFITLLAEQLRHYPLVPMIGEGEYRLAPVSIHTLLAAFAQALTPQHPARGQTVELCGPEVLCYRQLLDIISRRVHHNPPVLPLPVNLLRRVLKSARLLHLPTPITDDQLTMLLQENNCRDERAYQLFSLPRIPVAEGIKEYL